MEFPTDIARRIWDIRNPEERLIAIGEARFDAIKSLDNIPMPPETAEARNTVAYAMRTLQLLGDIAFVTTRDTQHKSKSTPKKSIS